MVKRRSIWLALAVSVISFLTWSISAIVETASAVTVGVLTPPTWKLVERLFSARVRTALQVNERMCINAHC